MTKLLFTAALLLSIPQFSFADKTELVSGILADFAGESCKTDRWRAKGLSHEQSFEISRCFMTTDFWDAYDWFGFGDGFGTANGLVKACTRAIGYTCTRGFSRFAVNVHVPHRLEIIREPGYYDFSGYGVDATSVLIVPGIEGDVKVSVSGHTDVNYKKAENISCTSLDHFDGCKGF